MDSRHHMTPETEKQRYELHNNSLENAGYIDWLNAFLDFAFTPTPAPAPGSKVLDFGSGPEPVMAQLMEERGCVVSLEDPFFAPGERGGSFDLITALEVFEHIYSPSDTIANLAKRLSPDGRLCISTKFLPDNHEEFETWHYRNDSTHIGFFTRTGLAEAASRFGLEEVSCDGTRYINFRLAHRGASC
jgi:SAM-dependent methyltransferase